MSAHDLGLLRRGIRLLAVYELSDADAADEVAQETLVRVLQAMREGRVRDVANIGAFARGVARHVLVDFVRERRRERSFDATAAEAQPDTRDDPLAALLSAEQLGHVRIALATLTQGDRDILQRAFFDDVSCAEMSQRLHEPAARIRKRKERALERLRRAFSAVAGSHTLGPAPTVPTERLRLVVTQERGLGNAPEQHAVRGHRARRGG